MVDVNGVKAVLTLTADHHLSFSIENTTPYWLVAECILDVDAQGLMNLETINFTSGSYIGKTAGVSTACITIAPRSIYRNEVSLKQNYRGLLPGDVLPKTNMRIEASAFVEEQRALKFSTMKDKQMSAFHEGKTPLKNPKYQFSIPIEKVFLHTSKQDQSMNLDR